VAVRFRKGLVAGALVVAALTARPSAQTPGTVPFVPGEILVKFTSGAAAGVRGDGHRQAGGLLLNEIGRTGVQLVSVANGDEAAAIARYRRNPNVQYAEPNYIRRIPTPASHSGGSAPVPHDHYFDEQWALHNTGQQFQCIVLIFGNWCLYQGTPDADIDAPEAWAVSGNAPVTVAVIDSGVDYTHPDLATKYLGGYDFLNGDSDPMDDHGHGTHVAGTIAAAVNNLTSGEEEGIAGVAPNAFLLAYKVCGVDGSCSDFAIQQAIAAAVQDGAKVINMSLGGPELSQSTFDAVQDAWNSGVVVVAGAGNSGTTDLFFPAAFDNVISVAAFDEDHRRASFSNYGDWVDVSAPGNVIMSTYRMSACSTSSEPGNMGCYTWSSGTSMATPHVSGAAALIWSRPDVTTNAQVVDILLRSADPVGVSGVRLDSWTIHGGLNLSSAVAFGSTQPLANAGPDRTITDTDSDGSEPVTLDGSGSSDSNGSIVSYEWFNGSTSVATGVTATLVLPVGAHTFTLEVTDNQGERDTDSVVITVAPANQVTVAASTAQATEAGSASGVFTIGRTGSSSSPLTIHYTISGTATADADFVALPGTVTIPAGLSETSVMVTPIDDSLYESNESVIITLVADPATYSLGSPSVATVTLVSDDLPPDLIVTTVSAPPTAGAGAAVVVTDTTKNQGTGAAPASTTAFFLSTNTTLDASDVPVGSRAVPALAAGAANTLSTALSIGASTAAGSYYVIAKADSESAIPESIETNNARVSGVVKIGPDLIVSAVSAPISAAAGTAISASDTTKNQGGGGAESSTTRFYLSSNTALDASDVMLGTRLVPALAAGSTNSGGVSLMLPSSTATGIYYVIAQADGAAAVPETTETNNIRVSGALRIGPDLIVGSLSGTSTAAAGSSITMNDMTKNQGAGGAPASSTGFYLSINSSIDATDTFLGSRSVGELAPGAASSGSVSLVIPGNTGPGTYYVLGRADWNSAVPETSETNNDRAFIVRIGGDLAVSALSVPVTAAANGLIMVNDTTKNQGLAPVAASETGFYLSLNAVIDSSDAFLGSRVAPPLDPSQISSTSTQMTIPAGTAPGTYWVIGAADWNRTVIESTESNNTRAASIRIGPDQTVTVLAAPSSAVGGTSISASDTTTNQGGDSAGPSVTSFYLSTNLSLDASDVLLGSRSIPSLAAGASDTGATSLPIPASTPAGGYYLISKADAGNAVAESLETNNMRTKAISIAAAP
jgi:subtilisin family serine protease/subtilase family serine protease